MSRARFCSVAVAVLLAVLAPACGKDSKDSGIAEGKAPSAGGASAKFAVPLPDGAKAEPKAAEPGGEAYRTSEKLTILDVDAFYQKQADGKPLKDFAWCGAAGYSADDIVRIWKKTETDQLKVQITSGKGVLIRVTELTDAPATTCPPSPPDLQQPPEGP